METMQETIQECGGYVNKFQHKCIFFLIHACINQMNKYVSFNLLSRPLCPAEVLSTGIFGRNSNHILMLSTHCFWTQRAITLTARHVVFQ